MAGGGRRAKRTAMQDAATSGEQGRREFVRAVMRGLGVGSVMWLGYVLGRKGVSGGCVGEGVCGECVVLSRCELAQGIAVRRSLGEVKHENFSQ